MNENTIVLQYAKLTNIFARIQESSSGNRIDLGIEEVLSELPAVMDSLEPESREQRVVKNTGQLLHMHYDHGLEMSVVPTLNVWTPQMLEKIVRAYSQLAYAQPIGFLCCDFRNLKGMNDRYGHKEATKLLVRLCTIIEEVIERRHTNNRPPTDLRTERRTLPRVLGRALHGDELVAVIPRATNAQMRDILTRIKAKLSNPENHLSLQVTEEQPGAGSYEPVAPQADFGFVIQPASESFSLEQLFSDIYDTQLRCLKKVCVV